MRLLLNGILLVVSIALAITFIVLATIYNDDMLWLVTFTMSLPISLSIMEIQIVRGKL